MSTVRKTVAQALVCFLDRQLVERDGVRGKLVHGVFGIFGHGNVTGLGEALENEDHGLRFVRANNEQGMVHAATAYAKQRDRLALWACTSSIGPGATNMITGAATATINRLPVLLLPGDVFADRQPDPVLQQLELHSSATVNVNDCFRPVSRYFDRVERPEQLFSALLNAMRVLTDPVETGAVTICLPQDVQTEAFDVPESFLAPRVWRIARRPPETADVERFAALLRSARRPLIVAGGGVHYAGACAALTALAEAAAIPVAETQAGKSALVASHPQSVGGVGVTGTLAANRLARSADVVFAVGSRLGDFTTMSKGLLGGSGQRLLHLNVDPADAGKLDADSCVADARLGLEALLAALSGHATSESYQAEVAALRREWDAEVERLYAAERPAGAPLAQTAVLGRLEAALPADAVVVCAAGSLPGDLHRLWRPRAVKGYHLEYGYSCMGYEIAGALGARLAEPQRPVVALVGDGSFLMLHSELVTALQEGVKIVVVLFDNSGFQCIRSLQRSQGSAGFGNELLRREGEERAASGAAHPIDFAALAAALGAAAFRAESLAGLDAALAAALASPKAALVEVEVDRDSMTGGYESWWRVGVAAVSESGAVRAAAAEMEQRRREIRRY
jgi:3D-(3,5/4)-trihydroxycyclohexane-1,2-dione acylhydrolase (decyclizing)